MPCTGRTKRRCKNDPECKWVVGEGCKMTSAASTAQRKLVTAKRSVTPAGRKRSVSPKPRTAPVAKRSAPRAAPAAAKRSASRTRSPLYIPSPVPAAEEKPKGFVASAVAWMKGKDKDAPAHSTPASQLPPGCAPSKHAKYLLRNSPAYPANQCCGVVLPGKDGRQYISRPDKNGVCHWHKV